MAVAKLAELLGVLLLVLGLCACAVKVPIDAHSVRYSPSAVHRAHSKVVIYIPASDQQALYSQQGVVAVGMLLDWQMAAGKAMAESSKYFFENYFSNVEVRDQIYVRGDCVDCALAVRPQLQTVAVNKLTMQSTVRLVFDIYDSRGALVVSLPVQGKSKFVTLDRLGIGLVSASVPGVSSLAGNRVLSKSVEDAFSDAFWRLHLAMKNHTETGALARNWLPKALRNKSHYGRYEFAAERAIQAVGCQLPEDGLRLITAGIGELYEAYCWQQEPFLVDCNGSQCTAVFPEPGLNDRGYALD